MTENKTKLHQKTFSIAWGDMDALGHVNNGKYFDYFQEARIEWLQTLDLDLNQPFGPVVIHVAATFYKPVKYPATVDIITQLNEVGRTSLELLHLLKLDGQLMAEGISKVVWVDYKKNKSHPLPEQITKLID